MSKKILMPEALTAENGAKLALMGEYFEERWEDCPHCGCEDNEEEGGVGCEDCEFEGGEYIKAYVTWTQIKQIYKDCVELFKEEGRAKSDGEAVEDQTSKARDFLVMIMPVHFSDYIRTELAGDFAVSLAEKITGFTPAKEEGWAGFQVGCPQSQRDMGGDDSIFFCTLSTDDLGEYDPCVEQECPLFYLKNFMEKK